MTRRLWRPLSVGILAASFLITIPVSANAEDNGASSSELAGSVNDGLLDLVAGSSQWEGSSDLTLQGLLSSANLLDSSSTSGSGSTLPDSLLSSESGYPLPTVDNIDEVKIVKKEVENRADRREKWSIASPSMKRVVDVQIVRPADPNAPAPMLYLLDGIGGNKNSSGWVNTGAVKNVFANENATVVMPLGAAASLYTDWDKDDPALGTIKWETFITKELAPLLESDPSLHFNDKRGIGGLSMGASGAVRMANNNPDFFNAAIGISGCYSTMDAIGKQTVNLIVGSRGGNVENMWGPVGSEKWNAQDVNQNPQGIKDMAVYLSAASGAAGDVDIKDYEGEPFYNMVAGLYLERGAHECTKNLEESLSEAGAPDTTVSYLDTGMHNWRNYEAQLQPAWDDVKHALD